MGMGMEMEKENPRWVEVINGNATGEVDIRLFKVKLNVRTFLKIIAGLQSVSAGARLKKIEAYKELSFFLNDKRGIRWDPDSC
jgi:hypothetical protein